jgi:hypothetical protein
MLDRGFVAPPTSTHNIACKPLPYVSASLGLLTPVGGKVLLPEPVPDQVAKGKGTDWNDYEASRGESIQNRGVLIGLG